jgi:hypothetical protein
MDTAKHRIFKRLIREYEFLLEDYEDVAEIHKQANVEMSSELNKAKPQDVFEADYLEEESEDEAPKEPSHNDKDLKKLFRKIVFICHPDKVKAEADGQRRAELAGLYNQAVSAHDEGNWALMVVVAIKLEIELPVEAEAQVEKIQEDTNKLREKINGMTSGYVWQWYQAEEAKRKEMVETYMALLSKSIRSKQKVQKEQKLILGLGHPRTGTGYTAKLLQSWGLDVGHEKMGEHGTIDWSLAAGKKSLWQEVDFNEVDWQWIIYCVRDPRETIPSLVYTEDTKEGSLRFRKGAGVRDGGNPIVTAINSIYRWDQLVDLIEPDFIFKIETESRDLFDWLEKNGIPVEWNEALIGQKQNTREHPSWEEMIAEFGEIPAKSKIKLNTFCRKYGYKGIFV